MDLQPYQQRVVDEQKDLEQKIEKLKRFLSTDSQMIKLDPEDRELLQDQFKLMTQYNEVLKLRIIRFN